MKDQSYYKVTCQRGHLGCNYHNGYITFYLIAESSLHAMNIAKKMPGVKHKRLPEKVEKITYEEYLKGKEQNAYERAMAK